MSEPMQEQLAKEDLTLIISTVDEPEQARALIAALLEKQLIACGSISAPVESHYVWQGEQHADTEYQLFLKTVPEQTQALIETLERIHPYDCPEILRLNAASSLAYAQWARQKTQ